MKKIFSITFLAIAIMSCTTENSIIPEPVPVKTALEQKFLSINPVVSTITTKGIVTKFMAADKMGLYVTGGDINTAYEGKQYKNLPAIFDGKTWGTTAVELQSNAAVLYGYYPYKGTIDPLAIPVEMDSQTDYLYAQKSTASSQYYIANIPMKHAMTLVSLVIMKNDYTGAGKLTAVGIDGIQTGGTMNCTNGTITKIGNTPYKRSTDVILDDTKITKTQIITVPTEIAKTAGTKINVTIDGKEYNFPVPTVHNWEAGYEYIYTLNLHAEKPTPVILDYELDIQYWTKFGKEDNIIVGANTTPNIRMSSNFTNTGKITYTGEAKMFGLFVTNYGDYFEGKLRFALYTEDGTTMVEQYQPYDISVESKNIEGWCIPCFVNVLPGKYRLVPLMQKKGTTEWFVPKYAGGVEDGDWIYTVQPKTNLPACRYLYLDGENYQGGGLIYHKKIDEPFNVNYYITNKNKQEIHGEIKAVWERTFGDFYEIWADDGITWSDEIGRGRIDIGTNNLKIEGKIGCTIKTERPNVNRWSGTIHLYYKADNSTEWVLFRCDCNTDLELMKTYPGLIFRDKPFPIAGNYIYFSLKQ